MKVNKRANVLLAVHSTAALRITSEYRTVFGATVLIIAEMVAIDLAVIERRKTWLLRQEGNHQQAETTNIKRETIRLWQE